MAQLVQAQRGQTQQKNHGDEKDARPDCAAVSWKADTAAGIPAGEREQRDEPRAR